MIRRSGTRKGLAAPPLVGGTSPLLVGSTIPLFVPDDLPSRPWTPWTPSREEISGSIAVVGPPEESSGSSALVGPPEESSGSSALVAPPEESSGSSAVAAAPMEAHGAISGDEAPHGDSGSSAVAAPPMEVHGASSGDEAPHGDVASSGDEAPHGVASSGIEAPSFEPIVVVVAPAESSEPSAVVAAAVENSGPDEALHGEAASSGPIESQHIGIPIVRLSGGSDLIVALYCEAARRLPICDFPELLHCLLSGGHCIGLLDPVSNIIFNTLNLLCRWRKDKYTPTSSNLLHFDPEDESTWRAIAFHSYRGQVVFLQAYFRYLSKSQASRYIYLSGADIVAAIRIAELERPTTHEDSDCFPDLLWDAAQFSLRLAAISAQHPIPEDVVLLCQPLVQESEDILAVVSKIQKTLKVEDIDNILSVLLSEHIKVSSIQISFPQRLTAPDKFLQYSFSTTGGSVSAKLNFQPQTYFDIRKLRCSKGLAEKVTSYLSSFHSFKRLDSPHTRKDISYLKMCLLDVLHAFYIKALSRLSRSIRGELLSSMLLAGYCYGPFDPITNITVNSIWYDVTVPVSVMHLDFSGYARDILHISSMRRLEICSLDGLLAVARTITGLSEYDVVRLLCKTHLCDLTRLLGDTMPGVLDIAFQNASDAAKHPLGKSHGKFLSSLCCDMELAQNLGYLVQTEVGQLVSEDRILEARRFIRRYYAQIGHEMDLDVPRVQGDYFAMDARIEAMVLRQRFLRKEIEKLLHRYLSQHPWEPVYELQTICGGQKSIGFLNSNCYHINFLAAQSDEETTPKFFFAQIWESKFQSDVIDGSEISFCCPLPNYDMKNVYLGRCSICESHLGKVVHPPCGMHAGVVGFERTLNFMNTCVSKESFFVNGITGLELVLLEKERDRHYTEVLQHKLSSPPWKGSEDGDGVAWKGMEMMVGLRLAFAELMRHTNLKREV